MTTDIKGQATGSCYVYQASLYCEACGEAIRTRITAEGAAPEDAGDETSYDSDDYPKGPHAVSESDGPEHCDACHVFLENDLTAEGVTHTTKLVHGDWNEWRLDSVAITQWAPFYDISPPEYVGVRNPIAKLRRVNLANAPIDGDGGECFVFAFGAYHSTLVAAWGRGVADCLEEAAGWLADNAPGFLSDLVEEYNEAFLDAHSKGATWEQADEHARETSETDMTYTESGWLTWEWTYVFENPTREDMAAFLGVK